MRPFCWECRRRRPVFAPSASRGLALGGVIEALLTSPLANLNAIDLGFTTGLNGATVAAFVDSHARLGRCNLRAAGGITAWDYTAIGQPGRKPAAIKWI